MPKKLKKAQELDGMSTATRKTTRLLLAVCKKLTCGVKIRLAKKWVTQDLVPHCACGAGEMLVQTRDFD